MIIEELKQAVLLRDHYDDVENFAAYLYIKVPDRFRESNIILDLLKYKNLTLDELLKFLNLSNKHRGEKKSFVIVNDGINYDIIPDEIVVVPTIQEAEDIVEMEEIERDLGF